MKLKLYWSYATRSLARGGQRTLLAIFCVAVGVLTIVALQLAGEMLNDALTSDIHVLNGGDIAVHSEGAALPIVQLGYFDSLKAQGTIAQYTPTSEVGVQRGNIRYIISAVDPATYPLGGALRFLAPSNGNLASLLQGNGVVVTKSLLRYLGAQVGDVIDFKASDGRAAQVRIGGVVEDGGLLRSPTMLIDLQRYAAIPSLSGIPVSLTWVYVDVPSHSDAEASVVARQITQRLPSVTTATLAQTLEQNKALVQNIRYFLQAASLLALLIGGVGIINTMQVQLRRRQLEIAMLKTMGYQQRDLILMFGLEAGILGLVGGVIGALAGIGFTFFIKSLIEQAFFLSLSTSIDLLTVLSGVAIGFFTTLIFGLLPIIRTSQIRPLAVLREVAEPRRMRSRLGSVGLVLLLVGLFFIVALTILQNVLIALAVVGGAGLLLFLLGFFFGGVAWGVGKVPVLDSFRWWYLLLVGLAIVVSAGITLLAPGFGILLLALALSSVVVVLLPRSWKANVRLALRNIGRQKARSATTLIALFIGVFAIGMGLVLGQNVKDLVIQIFSSKVAYNTLVLVDAANKPALDQQLANLPGLRRKLVNITTLAQISDVNGVPMSQVLQSDASSQTAPAGPESTQATSVTVGLGGYTLAAGAVPQVVIVKGAHDSQPGRNLTLQDAAGPNTLLPLEASQSPFNLKLGDKLTVQSQSGAASTTLLVVGFYTTNGFSVAPILTDDAVVTALSNGSPSYAYSLDEDLTLANKAVDQIETAIPAAQVQDLASISQSLDQVVDNIIRVLQAIALLALLAGVISIANTVGLTMLERRREMGLLKAIGYTSRSVLGEVMLENGLIGFIGAIFAMLLVTLAITLLGQLVFQASFSVGPIQVLAVVIAAGLLCMLVAVGVAWKAAHVSPLEVLRYE